MPNISWVVMAAGLGLTPGPLAEAGGEAVWQGVLWLAIIAGCALAAAPVLLWLRRRLMTDAGSSGSSLDLDLLRELRDRGELTIAEYERLRRQAFGLSPDHKSEPPTDR